MKSITVFTPTFNRAHTLSRVYESLCKQTSKDFKWLIIDDGSEDETRDKVDQWRNEKKIEIKYIYQENQGKQMAVNRGVKECDTELFAFLDSDDYYLNDTIERMLCLWKDISESDKVAGVIARRGVDSKKVLGKEDISINKAIINYCELVNKYNFYGDTCRVYRKNILLENLYPVTGEKFIPENVMFGKINMKYDLYFINEILSISGYLEDGYTKNYRKLLRKNPKGYMLSLNQSISEKYSYRIKIKNILSYIVWGKVNNIDGVFKECSKKLDYIALYPIGLILYWLKIPKWFFE